MRHVYVSDVGDGLCLAIGISSTENVLVDCGATVGFWNPSGGKDAFEGLQRAVTFLPTPKTLFLSHFHVDHYSGLVYAASHPLVNISSLPISRVFYPGIPRVPSGKEFMYALLTMNIRLLGDQTGIAGYELSKLITKLNGGSALKIQTIFQGDRINIGNSVFTVLWPPRDLSAYHSISVDIIRAVRVFEEAISHDEPTRRWYDFVKKNSLIEQNNGDEQDQQKIDLELPEQLPEFGIRRLPPAVERANWALRRAANRISLCFCEEQGDFISWGDLRALEIRYVIDYCLANALQTFGILVTPHHGTRWSQHFKKIRCERAVSSCGKKLFPSVISRYKEISKAHYVTWITGDVPFQRIRGHWYQHP
jgi:beta-lactamase superfamily II metal-dependent hydrolase